MKAILPLAVLLVVGCGGPVRETTFDCTAGQQCDQLADVLSIARAMLSGEIGESAANEAFNVDYVQVAEKVCLRRSPTGGCIAGEFFPTWGIVVGAQMWGLLHEGLHSAEFNAKGETGHDWPARWKELDFEFRRAVEAKYGKDWPLYAN